jgi:tRNA(Ile)-lysidine synthase
LLEGYNPSIDTALLRLGDIADADFSYIEEQAGNVWKEIVTGKPGILYLNRGKITALPYALKRQLFRMALQQLAGNLRDFEADHIEAMLSFLSKPGGKQLDLPHGIRLFSQYNNLILTTDEQPPCPFPQLEKEVSITIPGETAIPGWLIKAHISESAVYDENEFSACFDMDRTGTALSVRPRKRGDRFQPLGMAQAKKLQDFMVDARIPQSWRKTIPVLTSPAHILWVVGWRIDERVKVTESTQNVLYITFETSV